MDTATQLKDKASEHISKAAGYVDQAQSYIDQAQATVDGHIQTAKDAHAKASGYFDQVHESITGHVEKAKSFKDEAKSTFCGTFGIDALCGESTQAPVCTGPSCCAQSSCYSNSIPGLKCDSDRGATTCVGGSMISGKEGRCQCKFGSTCNLDGKCPSMTGVTRLFEDGQVVPKEDFSLSLAALFSVVGSSFLLGCIATTHRVRSWIRQPTALQREALIPGNGAVE